MQKGFIAVLRVGHARAYTFGVVISAKDKQLQRWDGCKEPNSCPHNPLSLTILHFFGCKRVQIKNLTIFAPPNGGF